MKALITGGSRGIGRSIVDYFKTQGIQVYFPTRFELDLSKPIFLADANFDIIINCAGVNILSSIEEGFNEELMRINYYAPLQIIQQCLPYMIEQKYGRIINIGSIWIQLVKAKRFPYSVSKSALHTLTKYIAVEYGQYNILANTVSPGFIDTELTRRNNTKGDIELLISKVPVHRLGTPQEVSKIVYQMTVQNTFLTGQNLILDGGYSCLAP